MVIIPTILNQYTDFGVVTRVGGDVIYIEGVRSNVDLVELETELTNRWEELFKKELLFSINDGCLKREEFLKPSNFQDLAVKASLGILSQEEREILLNYYTYVNTIREFCEELKQEVMNSNLSQISEIDLPEWVNWTPLPMNPVFVIRTRNSDSSE
jgi:hypothetical protein